MREPGGDKGWAATYYWDIFEISVSKARHSNSFPLPIPQKRGYRNCSDLVIESESCGIHASGGSFSAPQMMMLIETFNAC